MCTYLISIKSVKLFSQLTSLGSPFFYIFTSIWYCMAFYFLSISVMIKDQHFIDGLISIFLISIQFDHLLIIITHLGFSYCELPIQRCCLFFIFFFSLCRRKTDLMDPTKNIIQFTLFKMCYVENFFFKPLFLGKLYNSSSERFAMAFSHLTCNHSYIYPFSECTCILVFSLNPIYFNVITFFVSGHNLTLKDVLKESGRRESIHLLLQNVLV